VTPLLVALGGALGAPARLLLERTVSRRTGPGWGTVAVNLLGAFLLGVLVGGVETHGWSTDVLRFAGVGFLGAFTTFSTFAVETLHLGGRRRIAYFGATVIGALAAAAVGVTIGRA
jgi:CrcB protein